MWRVAASLGRLSPRASAQADGAPSASAALLASLRAYSRLSATQQARRLAAGLATIRGAAPSMRSVPRKACQPTVADFSAVAAANSWASTARHLCQQSLVSHSTALHRSALLALPRTTGLGPRSATPSAANSAAMRWYSNKSAAAVAHAFTRKTAGPAAAAAAAGARIPAALRPAVPRHSRLIMSAAKPGRTGAAAGSPAGLVKRAVLHPTAILSARSSRHFSRLVDVYEPSRVRVMMRRSMDPKVVLYALMGMNVAGFIWWRVDPAFMQRHFLVSLPAVTQGRPYTLLTSAVSQKDTMHLLSNLLGLYFFGREVGGAFGGRALLGLYIAGGIAGSTAHCMWRYLQILELPPYFRSGAMLRDGGALGSSGAVNAIMIVNVLLYPTQTVLLYGILPMPMFALGALWLYTDISGTMKGSASGVGHVAHLGGALTGVLFYGAYRLGRIRPRGYW